ncbi:MAG: hypothetical protein ABEJ86_02165 [Halococcoides sp.]
MKWVVLVACGVAIVASIGVVAGSGYAIDAPDAVKSPEPIERHGFTASSVLVIDPGDTGTFEVSGPDEAFNLTLYDSDARLYERQQYDGPGTVTWSFDGVPPGSYMMAVVPESTPVAIQPVLVRGYDLSVETRVDGATAVVTVDATRTADQADPIRELLVSVETAQGARNVTATLDGDRYRAEIDLAGLEPGSHRLLAVARGEKAFRGEREALAFQRSTLDVPEPTATTTATGPAVGTATPSGETTTGGPTTSDPTPGATDTPGLTTDTSTPTTTPNTTTATTPTPTTAPTATTAGGGAASTTTDRVIQPRSSTPTATGGPGFGAGLALLALVGAIGLLGRSGSP